jgi:hypothetical protein
MIVGRLPLLSGPGTDAGFRFRLLLGLLMLRLINTAVGIAPSVSCVPWA